MSEGIAIEKRVLLGELASIIENGGCLSLCEGFQLNDMCKGTGCCYCPADKDNFNKTIEALKEVPRG